MFMEEKKTNNNSGEFQPKQYRLFVDWASSLMSSAKYGMR